MHLSRLEELSKGNRQSQLLYANGVATGSGSSHFQSQSIDNGEMKCGQGINIVALAVVDPQAQKEGFIQDQEVVRTLVQAVVATQDPEADSTQDLVVDCTQGLVADCILVLEGGYTLAQAVVAIRDPAAGFTMDLVGEPTRDPTLLRTQAIFHPGIFSWPS